MLLTCCAPARLASTCVCTLLRPFPAHTCYPIHLCMRPFPAHTQGEVLWSALGVLAKLTGNVVACGNTLEKYRWGWWGVRTRGRGGGRVD